MFLIQSDGTNHEAMQNHNVHLNVVSSIAIPHGMMSQSIEVFKEIASHSRQACELQKMFTSKAAEVCELHLQEFASVGCPTWTDRIQTASETPQRMRSYHFGGDGGGVNKCQIETVLYAIKDVPNMSAGYFICFFHSIHLNFSDFLKVLEALECPLAYTKKYVVYLVIIINVWRSTCIRAQV